MLKKIISIICTIMLFFLSPSYSKATEECFENVSRSVFKFNLVFDEKIFEPIAKGYSRLPQPLKTGTSNFTSNISNLLSIPNSILQGNFKEFGHSVGSVFINSTIGILGFLNPAEKIGLKPSKEDVGQTLGKYGIGQGCYYVLPILGPTTLRDSLGLVADSFIDPFAQVTIRDKELLGISGNHLNYYSVKGTSAVDFRSDNLTNFESLEKNSIDLYSSFKSIYLQDRENKVKNTNSSDDDWGSLDK